MKPIFNFTMCFMIFILAGCLLDVSAHQDGSWYTLVKEKCLTTNGKHSGDIVFYAKGMMRNSGRFPIMGNCRLTYAFWTLVGEPVCDNFFSWELGWDAEGGAGVPVGDVHINQIPTVVRIKDLAKFPALLERLRRITPTSVTIAADIHFHTDADGRSPLGIMGEFSGKIEIKPDHILPAGKPGLSFSPGSPKWEDFFTLDSYGGINGRTSRLTLDNSNLSQEERNQKARINKERWGAAKHVHLTNVHVKNDVWPTGEINNILLDYARLEEKKISGPEASVILLMDVSGSMANEGRIEAAKVAAEKAALLTISQHGEVAVLAFSGEPSSPIGKRANFTTQTPPLKECIRGLNTGGGTPLAAAIDSAFKYMREASSPSSRNKIVVLLADGADDGASDTLANLRKSGMDYRIETIGLSVDDFAANQLRKVAEISGGAYHRADEPKDLARAFEDAMAATQILDLIGKVKKMGEPREPSEKESQTRPKKGSASMERILDGF